MQKAADALDKWMIKNNGKSGKIEKSDKKEKRNRKRTFEEYEKPTMDSPNDSDDVDYDAAFKSCGNPVCTKLMKLITEIDITDCCTMKYQVINAALDSMDTDDAVGEEALIQIENSK